MSRGLRLSLRISSIFILILFFFCCFLFGCNEVNAAERCIIGSMRGAIYKNDAYVINNTERSIEHVDMTKGYEMSVNEITRYYRDVLDDFIGMIPGIWILIDEEESAKNSIAFWYLLLTSVFLLSALIYTLA